MAFRVSSGRTRTSHSKRLTAASAATSGSCSHVLSSSPARVSSPAQSSWPASSTPIAARRLSPLGVSSEAARTGSGRRRRRLASPRAVQRRAGAWRPFGTAQSRPDVRVRTGIGSPAPGPARGHIQLHRLGLERLEPGGESLVQAGANRFWQRLIGRVADQEVMEAERLLPLKRHGVRPDQLFAHERIERGVGALVAESSARQIAAPRWKTSPSIAACASSSRSSRARPSSRSASSASIVDGNVRSPRSEMTRPSPPGTAGWLRSPDHPVTGLDAELAASWPISFPHSRGPSGRSSTEITFSLPPPQPGPLHELKPCRAEHENRSPREIDDVLGGRAASAAPIAGRRCAGSTGDGARAIRAVACLRPTIGRSTGAQTEARRGRSAPRGTSRL